MPIPKSIEAAGTRADEIMRQQQGTPATAPEGTPATPEAAAQAAPQTPAFEQTWEQKYKVLHGKYNAEVPRLHSEIKDLKTAMDGLKTQMSARPAAASPDFGALTPEEREQYGEDFLKVVGKVAAASAAQLASSAPQVDLTFADRLARIEDEVAETKEDKFFRQLGESAANWETLNTDAGFLGWLAGVDPMTGHTRQDMFNDAYNKLSVNRVAAFFNAYGGGNQSSVSRTAQQQKSLESQVVPRQSNAAPAPPQGKKLWTQREIAKFYDDIRRGTYKDDVAGAARIEQDIFSAQVEGRIR